LISVAEQNDSRARRHGGQESRHQRQVDHRRLVDQHEIGNERVALVKAKASARARRPEGAVDRRRLLRDGVLDLLRAVERLFGLLDGLDESGRGFAGGSHQHHARRALACRQGLLDE